MEKEHAPPEVVLIVALFFLFLGFGLGHFFLPSRIPEQVFVGADNVKKCLDKGGDFEANQQSGYLQARCTVPEQVVHLTPQ